MVGWLKSRKNRMKTTTDLSQTTEATRIDIWKEGTKDTNSHTCMRKTQKLLLQS